MVILYIILFIIIIWNVKYSDFHDNYMSLSSTNAIKGIFCIFILYRHMISYIALSTSFMDRCFIKIDSYLDQLIVAMFLFYSGYGIMLSYQKKPNYLKGFFRNRITKILVHFDIAVFCFISLQSCLGKTYCSAEYLLSLIGWTSIGNSNWFIFDILALYICAYIALNITRYTKKLNIHYTISFISILCFALWVFLYYSKPNMEWWINTIVAFPLGMYYFVHKNKIDSYLMTNSHYLYSLVFLTCSFLTWHFIFRVDIYGVSTCLFCLMLTFLCMRVKTDNAILQFLGTYSFSIYIMQRWPMLIYEHLGWNAKPTLFVAICIPSAIIIAYIFQKVLLKVDKLLFAK